MDRIGDDRDPFGQSTADIADTLEKMRVANDLEHKRTMFYGAYPSLECLLDPTKGIGFRGKVMIAFCCILEVTPEGGTKIEVTISGRVPSDTETYLPLDAPAGRYLVGCVMPEGGWAAFSNIRPEFSVRLRADDSFSYGFNGELNSNLQIVRELSRPKR